MSDHASITDALAQLGASSLTEDLVARHIRPLFSRALARSEIYLANHALGRPLDQTARDVQEALDLWYTNMDEAWTLWLAEMDAFRSRIARLINCPRADAIIPKTSAGQGLRAVLNAHGTLGGPTLTRPINVVATRGEFDSVDFTLRAYVAKRRAKITWVDPDDAGLFSPSAIADAITPTVDLVVVSQVVFSTGQILGDLKPIADVVHAVGGHLLVDCYHAAGVIPIDFDNSGADFAIGGNYKYTRGGPGACWLAVHPRHLIDEPRSLTRRHAMFTLDTGWFAKGDRWLFLRDDDPALAAGGDAWLENTPAVLPFYQARAGLQFTLGVGVDRLRRYSLELQAYLRDRLASCGVKAWDFGLSNPPGHGGFLLLPSSDPRAAVAALKARGVNVDARATPAPADASSYRSTLTQGDRSVRASATSPGFLRVGPDLLTTRDELDRAARLIAETLA